MTTPIPSKFVISWNHHHATFDDQNTMQWLPSHWKVSSFKQYFQVYYGYFTRWLLKTTVMSDKEEGGVITPPAAVRGMKTLDKSLFSRTVSIPALKVPSKHVSAFTKSLKMALFKMQRVKPVADLAKDDPLHSSHKLFLLDPRKFKTSQDFSVEEKQKLAEFGVSVEELSYFDLEVGYENWNAAEILRAVLPETSDGVSGYSIIGHIAHLNLKAEVLDYKHLIGEVILDKNSSVKTVVNKVNVIDNTFRNFQMELLTGEDNLVTRAKENGCVFQMDFSKVYWNPRLSTEHARIVELLKPGDVLYDVFAGVGPFAIPAARRGVLVLANDLNPHSHSALTTNIKLNKVKADKLQAYNLDGRDFILTVLKPDLTARLLARAKSGTNIDDNATKCDTNFDDNGAKSDTNVNDNTDCSSQPEANITAEVDGDLAMQPVKGDSPAEAVAEDSSKTNSVELGRSEHQDTPAGRPSSVTSTSDADKTQKLLITMNLPALALEFLDAFCGLLSDFPQELRSDPCVTEGLPTVMCYCFEQKNDDTEGGVRSRAEKIVGRRLPEDARVRSVRNVAPGKEMMCLQFQLTPEIVFGVQNKGAAVCIKSQQAEEEAPPRKRQKMSEVV
ncbi:tRNA (guanine(37)-N(1))-methyltransferase-like isoform X2 [Babylonia areolata]|uniref:tRNA (guanine(37)-N(1))-methyltransferase-like isoform X2 n=1 Tax=Babylonia areolata TaxID=304850 RepID=UPI003FD13BFD